MRKGDFLDNQLLLDMINKLDKKTDKIIGKIDDIHEDLNNVSKTVAVHDHKIISLNKEIDNIKIKRLEETKDAATDRRWRTSTIIALLSLTIAAILAIQTFLN